MATSTKKCISCKERKRNEKMIQTPNKQWFCDASCVASYANKRYQKQKQAAKNKKQRVAKESVKTKGQWLSEAQAAFNKYIRIRDKKDPCISCGKPCEVIEGNQSWKVGGCWDAGHFQTRGAKGQLRFVLFNVHKQCKSCNGGGGRFSSKASTVDANYRDNLVKKIGLAKVELLENNNEIDLKKGDIDYLKRIKKIFGKKARLYERRFR